MNNACFECGSLATVDHHVVPRSRGGTKTVPLCGTCHGKAHHSNKAMSVSTLSRESLKRKIASGHRVGEVRYGYALGDDGKTLIPNADEQSGLRVMHQLKEQGSSLRAIAVMLESLGYCTKNGKSWSHSTVGRILSRTS